LSPKCSKGFRLQGLPDPHRGLCPLDLLCGEGRLLAAALAITLLASLSSSASATAAAATAAAASASAAAVATSE